MIDRNLAIQSGSADGSRAVRSLARRMLDGVEVGACSHGLVGRGDDIGGGVDKAAAGWFGNRDELD